MDLKAEVRKAVQEALSEELPKIVPKSKAKTTKNKTEYDETRRVGPDPRDPRASKSQWPCFGTHAPTSNGNRFGRWEECHRCAHRLSYIPAVNAPAQSTHVDLPQNVVEALARLRSDGWTPEDVTTAQVKAMTVIVAKEYQLLKTKKKPACGYKENDLKKKLEKANRDAEEVESSDKESYEVVSSVASPPKQRADASMGKQE